MRKTITKFFSLALVLCAVNTGLAQTAKTNKADKKFEKYEYVDAIEVYKNIAEKGYKSMNTLQKLADALFSNENKVDTSVLGLMYSPPSFTVCPKIKGEERRQVNNNFFCTIIIIF